MAKKNGIATLLIGLVFMAAWGRRFLLVEILCFFNGTQMFEYFQNGDRRIIYWTHYQASHAGSSDFKKCYSQWDRYLKIAQARANRQFAASRSR